MSPRASFEQTIWAEVDGFGPALSHDAFSNTLGEVVDDGDLAVEPPPHAPSADTVTSANAPIALLRINVTLLTAPGRQASPGRCAQVRLDRREERRITVGDQPSGRR